MENPFSYQNKHFENKDVVNYVTSVSREEVFDLSRLEENRPWIILPEEFYEATNQMCQVENETRGVILVSRQGEAFQKGRLSAQALITIGQGSSVAVFPDERKFKAINKLLHKYGSEVMAIDFHSHTVATGEAFANTFSNQDNQSLANNVNRHAGYMHVLFTPKNILTFGKGKPQFAVAKYENGNSINTQAYWKEIFNQYLNELG